MTMKVRNGSLFFILLSQQAPQSLLYAYFRLPAELLAYARQIRNVIHRHGMRQSFVGYNVGLEFNHSADRRNNIGQGARVLLPAAQIIKAVDVRGVNEAP